MQGKIYANRLSYFKDIEGKDDTGRADRHEGAIGWFQPDQGRFTINELDITGDLAAPVEIQREWFKLQKPVLRTMRPHTGDIDLGSLSDHNIEDLRKTARIASGLPQARQIRGRGEDYSGIYEAD